jgi:hypothetical protein
METLKNQPMKTLDYTNFEILRENEMDQLKGGTVPPAKSKDVFDPDEH